MQIWANLFFTANGLIFSPSLAHIVQNFFDVPSYERIGLNASSLTNILLAFVTRNSHSSSVRCSLARPVYIRLNSRLGIHKIHSQNASTRTNVISAGGKANAVWHSVIFIEMWIRVISHNDRFMYISLFRTQ